MPRCPVCLRDLPLDTVPGKCPHCAETASVDPATAGSGANLAESVRSARPEYQLSGSLPLDDARFAPGRIFAARYRIVSLLGRGAMGEVYRADDLRIGQPVALKLLAVPGARWEERLQQFVAEVRLARHIAHPNVCRVYDIGKAEGWHYLSMEYVDGETLASLLRRIGRMPREKAMDITRQLCAGLAAAHDGGVLHRDIKPSNIMIDGRGRVRLMDFGLAVATNEVLVGEVAGTPAYMAPEQVAGDRVAEQSDLYSLGLVLYELFTGRQLYPVRSIDERRRFGPESPPLGSSLQELEPAVDTIVRACLRRDPATRPRSALALAADLPGGDLLTSAVAEGRLLSPDIVAAAGQKGELRSPVAWTLFAFTIIGILVVASRAGDVTQLRPSMLPRSPEVLADRARDIVAVATGTVVRGDSEYWFSPAFEAALTGPNPLIREIRFVYRQSLFPLVPQNLFRVVTEADPSPNVPGMVSVITDASGRLMRFDAVRTQADVAASHASADWPTLFAEAGADIREFAPMTPIRTAPVPSDQRFAWNGPQSARGPLQVSAATLNGYVVYFEAFRDEPIGYGVRLPFSTGRPLVAESLLWLLVVLVFVVAGVLARSHVRRGEGDRRGARILSGFVICGGILSAILHAHHVPLGIEEMFFLFGVTGWAVVWGGLSWLVYMGLEPPLRRAWPTAIVSWTRLFSGSVHDPLVGRDLLLGVLAGVCNVGIIIGFFILFWRSAPELLVTPALDSFRSVRAFTNNLVFSLLDSIQLALVGVFLLVLVRRVVKNTWVAALIFAVVVAMPLSPLGPGQSVVEVGIRSLTITVVTVTVALRLGLLSYATMMLVEHLLLRFPITFDRDAWYFGSSTTILLLLAALAAYGCVIALGVGSAGSGGLRHLHSNQQRAMAS